MKKWLVDSMILGTITLTGGAVATFSSSGGVGAALAGGTAGAAGSAALVTKRREEQFREEISQVKQVFNSTVRQLNQRIAANDARVSTEVASLQSLHQRTLEQVRREMAAHNARLGAQLANVNSQLLQLQSTVGAIAELPLQEPKSAPPTVAAWLNALGVPLHRWRLAQEKDALFDRVASYLGSNYSTLAPLHQKMKRSLETQNHFSFSLGDKSEKELRIFHDFRKLLTQTGLWLSHYSRTNKIIYFNAPSTSAELINFFQGGWFERFVYCQVSDLLASHELEYQHLANFHLSFHGKEYELDLLFLVNHTPILIECKAGQICNGDLDRFCQHKQALSVPKETALLVSLEISDASAENWSMMRDITVANMGNCLSQISKALSLQPRPEPQKPQKINPPVPSPTNQSSTLLKNKSLRPLPKQRQTVLSELIKVFGEDYQPIPLSDIEKLLAQTLQESLKISKSQVHDILNAVLRSRCLLSDTGATAKVRKFIDPVSGLVSKDKAFLEKKCIESYASAVLATDLNYFENPDKVREFEETVGGQVPDAETLAQLKANILSERAEHAQ